MNHDHWDRLAAAMRKSGAAEKDGDTSPPPGFATRVLAQVRADARADKFGLVLWRRWALGLATASCLGCGALFLALPDPDPQILPLPEFELPSP